MMIECTKDKTRNQINAEWVPYLRSYRLYDPKNPQDTIAYEDDLDLAEQHALENGYDKLVVCDAESMHVERC